MLKQTIRVLSSIGIILLGILLAGFGFTMQIGHPTNTTCFLLGLGVVFLGVIYFIKIAND